MNAEPTPRQAQVQRFVEAADQFEVDVVEMGLAGVPIADAAIDAFVHVVKARQPWTGLGDLSDDDIASFKRRALWIAGAKD